MPSLAAVCVLTWLLLRISEGFWPSKTPVWLAYDCPSAPSLRSHPTSTKQLYSGWLAVRLIVSHSTCFVLAFPCQQKVAKISSATSEGPINPWPLVGVCGQGRSSHPTPGPLTRRPTVEKLFWRAVIGAKWWWTKAPSVLPAGLNSTDHSWSFTLDISFLSPMWEERTRGSPFLHHHLLHFSTPSALSICHGAPLKTWDNEGLRREQARAGLPGLDLWTLINPMVGRSFQSHPN